jgi:uncharacterized protein YlxW (UPF0749 family)
MEDGAWESLLFFFAYAVFALFFVYFVLLTSEFSKKLSDWLQVGKRYTELKEENDSLRKECRELSFEIKKLENKIKRLGES